MSNEYGDDQWIKYPSYYRYEGAEKQTGVNWIWQGAAATPLRFPTTI